MIAHLEEKKKMVVELEKLQDNYSKYYLFYNENYDKITKQKSGEEAKVKS